LIAPNWGTLASGTLTNNFTLNVGGNAGQANVWSNTNTNGTI